ncbi:MAG: hypothetical protein DRQ62_16060 [Gammaproteobacteria bacterium]|nr:MAG: hypothetical protein DRQ62_16060 [Gammaproteobacteria bacterium]
MRANHLIVLLLVIFSLAGCAAQRGSAPVTDRSGKATASGERWVTVRRGDTLFSISFAHGRSHLSVAKLNRIKPPYTIYPGQRIKVSGKPAARTASKKTGVKKQTASSNASTKRTKNSRRSTSKSSSVKWTWPANGKVIRAYSANAPRKKGIGISGSRGQAIKAAAAGKVVYSGDGLLGYGNLIIVKHNETYLSAYAHSLKVFVKEGQVVKKGQKVASMGNNENGNPMLHFEIRRHGKPVNPVSYLPGR